MPEDDAPSISIDTDWKKQAQEEKRRLAEEAQRKKTAGSPASAPEATGHARAASAGSAAPAARARRARRDELPEASFTTLVHALASQALVYLGGVALASGEAVIDLDTAKHQIDLLAVLEEKTKGNLTSEEQKALDVALYEARTRYAGVASRYIL